MGIDLSRFKVVFREKVYNVLSLQDVVFAEHTHMEDTLKKPKFIEILVINEDGNIVALRDEAWMFQFIPVLEKK